MKRLALISGIIVLLSGLSIKVEAQYYFYDNNYYDNPLLIEFGGSVGAMNSLTDIGGRKGIGKKFIKDLNMGKTQLAGSFYVGATYKYAVTIRAEVTIGKIAADDKVLQSVAASTFGRYERNLSFRTNISEFMLAGEFHPMFIFMPKDNDDWTPPLVSPYLLAGVGLFHFNPQANLNGKWVDLQPLNTEGQGSSKYPERTPYKLNQICIPIGIGARYELGTSFFARAEFVYRITNTDYLDDVSTVYPDPTVFDTYPTAKRNTALLLYARQKELDPTFIVTEGDQRGSPKHKDAYMSFNLKIGYILGREKRH